MIIKRRAVLSHSIMTEVVRMSKETTMRRIAGQLSEMIRSLVEGMMAALRSGDRGAILQAGRRAAVLGELADGARREAVCGVPSLDAAARLEILTAADLTKAFQSPLEDLGRWGACELSAFDGSRLWFAELLSSFLEDMNGAVLLGPKRKVPKFEAKDLAGLRCQVMDRIGDDPSRAGITSALAVLRALDCFDSLFGLLGGLRRLV
ncbi:hypothetical protein GCWU000246_01398 [Jonquetella anthropi E3_33 E1]|nr:hypothetical protein GCWU000246_01398 [Jonquetella anthropi E3_33 E1]